MKEMAALLFVTPVVDLAVKRLLRRGMGPGSIPLGPLGSLRIVDSRIWLARIGGRQKLTLLWSVWLISAIALAILSMEISLSGWSVGLLLGGSLSHLLETTFKGSVTDYVCLRFWPAFNLADVAITVGVIGLVLGVIGAIKA
jgi:signal peptidase II